MSPYARNAECSKTVLLHGQGASKQARRSRYRARVFKIQPANQYTKNKQITFIAPRNHKATEMRRAVHARVILHFLIGHVSQRVAFYLRTEKNEACSDV